MTTTVLTAHDVRRIVERDGVDSVMDQMIHRLTEALRNYEPTVTRVRARDGFTYSDPEIGLLEWMPILELGGCATIKVVAYRPSNPTTRALPTILSTVSLFSSETGHVAGIVDGTLLTALRTGAASAVASRFLASPSSRRLGLIGCGVQAVTQLHALSRVFDLESVFIFDTDPMVSHSFSERVSSFLPHGLTVRVSTLDKVVSKADILCTQTSVEAGCGPVFEDRGLKSDVHVNAVGCDLPNKTELPLSLLERSFVCPDYFEQAVREGECQQIGPEAIGVALPEVVKSPEQYRYVQLQSSVFDSTGFALEDHVAAQLLFDRADALGLGTELEIECVPTDPLNPYGSVAAPVVHVLRPARVREEPFQGPRPEAL